MTAIKDLKILKTSFFGKKLDTTRIFRYYKVIIANNKQNNINIH